MNDFFFHRSWEVGVFPSRIASRERNHWRMVGLALPNSKNPPWLFITLLKETLKLRPRPRRYQTKQNCPAWLTLQVNTFLLFQHWNNYIAMYYRHWNRTSFLYFFGVSLYLLSSSFLFLPTSTKNEFVRLFFGRIWG